MSFLLGDTNEAIRWKHRTCKVATFVLRNVFQIIDLGRVVSFVTLDLSLCLHRSGGVFLLSRVSSVFMAVHRWRRPVSFATHGK